VATIISKKRDNKGMFTSHFGTTPGEDDELT
jgi:hypothetical protein